MQRTFNFLQINDDSLQVIIGFRFILLYINFSIDLIYVYSTTNLKL